MNGALLHTDPALALTPTATTANASYPATNGNDGIPDTQVWSTGTTFTYAWDAGAGLTLTVAAASIHNHNLTATATVKLQHSTNGSTWTDVNLTAQAADIAKILDAPLAKRYWRFNVTVLSGVVKAGEFCLWSTATTLGRNYNWGYRDITDAVCTVTNVRGQFYQDDLLAQSQAFGLDFDAVSVADHALIRAAVNANPVVFVPSADLATCYHGIFPSKKIEAPVMPDGRVFSLDFVANSFYR